MVKWAFSNFLMSIIFMASSGALMQAACFFIAILIGVIVPGAIIIAIILAPYISQI